MTSDKSLKRRVRERMERTGESYTTARRRVLASAPPPSPPQRPAGLLPGYDVFGGGAQHDSGLLGNVLRAAGAVAPHTGRPWTEAALAGLAGGIGFMYFVFEYAGHVPTMTIVGRAHPEPYLPAALRRAGLPCTESTTSSAKRAERTLRDAVAAGRPVVCTVDRAALPWQGSDGGYGPEPHEVAVAGIDGDLALVDDERVRPHVLPMAQFLTAWSGYRTGRHHALVVGDAEQPVDLGSAVDDAVSSMCGRLTGPVLGNAFDVNFGFSGMRKLAAQLRDGTTATGWARRYGEPRALFSGLRRLHDCLEVEYGGPGATRPLVAEFLTEMEGAFARPAWREAAALLAAAGTTWSAVASTAVGAWAPLRGHDDLVTERLRLLLTGADDAGGELRALRARAAGWEDAFAADPPPAAEVRDLLAELADLVDRARVLEEEAVGVLTAGTARPGA
jgi:hypothetical protein